MAASAALPTPDLLAGLTPSQREAVLHTGSPLLIIAGPGSGETEVITRLVPRLVGPLNEATRAKTGVSRAGRRSQRPSSAARV